MYSFFVEGTPRGKARPRFSRGHTYTPKTTTDYEKLVASQYHGKTYTDALRLDITAYFAIPKSYTKKQIKAIREGVRPLKKPDIDNIAKIIMDALNGIAYEDDKQVVDLRLKKEYCKEGQPEGVSVAIMGVEK